MDTNNNYFLGRIESVEDKQVNDKLFTLYGKLIKPIKDIEDLQEGIWTREAIIKEASVFKLKTLGAKLHIIIAIIIAVLGMYTEFKESKFVQERYDNSVELQLQYENSDILFLEEGFRPFYGTIYYLSENDSVKKIGDAISLSDSVLGSLFGALFLCIVAFVLVPFLIALILQLPLVLLLTVIKKIKDRNTIKRCINENEVAQKRIYSIFEEIEEYICFIPPSYRLSAALSYFVESYANSRVSNLKEAVNAYDLYVRDARMNANIRHVSSQLSDIAFNQVTMMDQLNTLHKDIWASSFLFS